LSSRAKRNILWLNRQSLAVEKIKA